jgi:hypothetical protein
MIGIIIPTKKPKQLEIPDVNLLPETLNTKLNSSSVSTVALTGQYADLNSKPHIPTVPQDINAQPVSANLTALTGQPTTAYGRGLLNTPDGLTLQSTLGVAELKRLLRKEKVSRMLDL